MMDRDRVVASVWRARRNSIVRHRDEGIGWRQRLLALCKGCRAWCERRRLDEPEIGSIAQPMPLLLGKQHWHHGAAAPTLGVAATTLAASPVDEWVAAA